jgi:ribosome-binding factor A
MSKREEQLKEELMHLAGQFLAREAGLQSLITVTRSEMSPDMKFITIFISVFPESAEKAALDFCKRERSAFREYVLEKSALHFPPTIDFELDIGEKNRQRIDELTKK